MLDDGSVRRGRVASDGALHALFVHGIGEQTADFAESAAEHLADAALRYNVRLYARSAHWAPLADALEADFRRRVEARGAAGRPAQRLVTGTLADALTYQSNPGLRLAVSHVIDTEVLKLRGRHVTIFAHSLGGLAVFDWLRARPRVRDVTLVTMGCNLELFYIGREPPRIAQLEAPGAWLNLYDKHDMLGFPIVSPTLRAENVQVNVGGWLQRWNGLSHLGYWDDRALWSKKIPALLLGA